MKWVFFTFIAFHTRRTPHDGLLFTCKNRVATFLENLENLENTWNFKMTLENLENLENEAKILEKFGNLILIRKNI